MIHSGSRGIGYKMAGRHNKIAQKLCTKWHSQIPNKDHAFLPMDSDEGKAYWKDMHFSLAFAKMNRTLMMLEMLQSISTATGQESGWSNDISAQSFDIHHNYAALENHYSKNVVVHRKGATSARKGQLGIIPGSMGTSSYIVEGLGNPESFHSCSHGAGRCMGRKQAKKTLSMEEFSAAMEGIVCDVCEDNLDEAPQAYKDISTVMKNQEDLVKITHKLRALAVVKG